MRLSADDLTVLAGYAVAAARDAGELITSYANRSVEVRHKAGGESFASQVVTEVDLLSERLIVNILKPSCEQYDLALLTEESADDRERLDKDYFWCVDPMDGTLAFTESIPGYAVSIALVSQSGEPVIGVVYDPVTQSLYSAVRGQGAMRNGVPWSLDLSAAGGRPLTLVCDRGFLAMPYAAPIRDALNALSPRYSVNGLVIRESNGAVLNACWALENFPAVYLKCPKAEDGGGSLWDFAATAALFNELGCDSTDVHGEPLDLNRADSSFMNHRGVFFSTAQLLASERQALWALCSR
ncbi:MAG: inositol monophosphatase [Gammaproteobacteria bacterium]|nr:inositol monophosphatase [Gammaproteobacteria bacterium]